MAANVPMANVKKDGPDRTVRHRFATTLLAVKTAESATHPTIASASKTTLRATTADATVCVLTVSKVPPLLSPSFASPSPSAAVCNSTSRRRRERSSSKDELLARDFTQVFGRLVWSQKACIENKQSI